MKIYCKNSNYYTSLETLVNNEVDDYEIREFVNIKYAATDLLDNFAMEDTVVQIWSNLKQEMYDDIINNPDDWDIDIIDIIEE